MTQDIHFDLAFPPIAAPARDAFVGVDDGMLRKLVTFHHDLLRRSSIGDLFPSNPKRFADVVARIAAFVVEMIHGSPDYAQARGLVWFRTRHLALTIDETARNVWLAAMLVAFDEVGFPAAARQEFWNWVEALSIRAITRRTMIGQPRRYPLEEAATALAPFMAAHKRK